MMKNVVSALLVFHVFSSATNAQSGSPMTGEELTALTANGITLQLGGSGMGYAGELVLTNDGKGDGGVTMDNGDKLSIVGTWAIKDGKFCRAWQDLDDGKEVCETWMKTSDRSVEVYNGDKMLGVNSW